MQRALHGFYVVRQFAFDLLTFVAIRLYGIENCTLADVKARRYPTDTHPPLNLDHAKDLDGLLAAAKERQKESLDRRAFVSDKAKTLITLNSALLALLAAFLPKVTDFGSPWASLMLYGGVVLLLTALLVMWVYFDIKNETVMELRQEEVGLEKDDLKKSLINAHLQCQRATDRVTDYLADLYKTARFLFLAGFLLVFVIFSVNYFARPPASDAEGVVEQLRADPKLIELLRGPRGEQGERGERGEPGVKGDKGDKGDTAPGK